MPEQRQYTAGGGVTCLATCLEGAKEVCFSDGELSVDRILEEDLNSTVLVAQRRSWDRGRTNTLKTRVSPSGCHAIKGQGFGKPTLGNKDNWFRCIQAL